MKRMLGVLMTTLLLMTSLTFAPAVLADNGDTSADVKATGTGKLTAEGDGIAVLSGRGVVGVSGNGILWVRDLAGDAKIDVTGYGSMKQFADGWTQYAGIHGTANIKGSNIRIVIAGTNVNLDAKGHGKALLWGHGTYSINSKSGQWENKAFGRFLTL